MSSSAVSSLIAGGVFLLALVFYRYVLPRLVEMFRELRREANKLVSQRSGEGELPGGPNAAKEQNGGKSATHQSVTPGTAIQAARALSTAILIVVWPILTFVLPFTGFYSPFLIVFIAYPIVWFFSGTAYKSALNEGRRSLLAAGAPLLLLLVTAVVLGLIGGLLKVLGK